MPFAVAQPDDAKLRGRVDDERKYDHALLRKVLRGHDSLQVAQGAQS